LQVPLLVVAVQAVVAEQQLQRQQLLALVLTVRQAGVQEALASLVARRPSQRSEFFEG
jgi:hypothetical protein